MSIANLAAEYDDGIVALCGECDTAETFEKAVLLAGNVKGAIGVYTFELTVNKALAAATEATTSVVALEPPPEATSEKQTIPIVADQPKVEYYVIQSGDALGEQLGLAQDELVVAPVILATRSPPPDAL